MKIKNPIGCNVKKISFILNNLCMHLFLCLLLDVSIHFPNEAQWIKLTLIIPSLPSSCLDISYFSC